LEKIRVGAVSYRNAKPLVYGLELPEMTNIIELSFDYPARLVEQLKIGTIDVGLIPVAAINRIPGAKVVGRHGIAADGAVGSVALFSHCPMEQIEVILLDYQSRTSVALARFLLRNHWKKNVRFLASQGDEYMNEIRGKTGGLIIGDRALVSASKFPYMYDLASAWKQHTGLPFVFAVWVTTLELSPSFLMDFERANEIGLNRIGMLAEEWALPGVDMLSYFKDKIRYELDAQMQEGLQLFLNNLEDPACAGD